VTSLATATVHNETFMLTAAIRRRQLQFSECFVEKQPTYLSYLRWLCHTIGKAGIQKQKNKAGFPLEFTPHSMRGGNNKQQTNLFYRAFSENISAYTHKL